MPQPAKPEQLSLLPPIVSAPPAPVPTCPSPAGPVLLDYWLSIVRASLRTSHDAPLPWLHPQHELAPAFRHWLVREGYASWRGTPHTLCLTAQGLARAKALAVDTTTLTVLDRLRRAGVTVTVLREACPYERV